MYEEFFGLKRSPFELSPDPFFLFSSEKSQEAMASISYAVCRRKGFVVMTGEVGTGKTLLLRCLFELWEREQIPFAYFIGPRLSTVDFLSYIAFELGLQVAEPTKGNLLRAMYGFLLAQYERGQTTVLVIDEAHQMPRSVLEEIRLLTNFETAQQKLVQILLVGQPELEKKLDSVELRSLKQRIAVRCRLEPLSGGETAEYIGRRLDLAGLTSPAGTIFPAETVAAIHRYAQGIPRLVNSICNQAMMAAYARRVRVVPTEIVDEVASHFRLRPPDNPSEQAPLSQTNPTEAPPRDMFSEPAPAGEPGAEVPDPRDVSDRMQQTPTVIPSFSNRTQNYQWIPLLLSDPRENVGQFSEIGPCVGSTPENSRIGLEPKTLDESRRIPADQVGTGDLRDDLLDSFEEGFRKAWIENELTSVENQPTSTFLTREVEEVRLRMGAGGAFIALRDHEGVRCVASAGDAPAVGSRLQLDSRLTKDCLETGHAMVCEDVEGGWGIGPSIARSLHLRSAIAVPIQRQGSSVGVIEAFSPRPSAFRATHVADLQQMADLLAEDPAVLEIVNFEAPASAPESAHVAQPPEVAVASLAEQQMESQPLVALPETLPDATENPPFAAVGREAVEREAIRREWEAPSPSAEKKRIPGQAWVALAGVAALVFFACLFWFGSSRPAVLRTSVLPPVSVETRQAEKSAPNAVTSPSAKTSDLAADASLPSPKAEEEKSAVKSGVVVPVPVAQGKPPASSDGATSMPRDSKLPATLSDNTRIVSPEPPSPAVEAANLEAVNLPVASARAAIPAVARLIPPPMPIRSVNASKPEFALDHSLKSHAGWVTGVAFSSDGRRLASGSWDQTVKFWDVNTGQELRIVASKMKEVQAVALSRDGRWLAAENSSDMVTLWDATTGREVQTLPSNKPLGAPGSNFVYSIAFSPDGRWLASGVDDKTVRVWDVLTGRMVRDLTGMRRSVMYAAFSPDGRLVASGDDDKNIRIWDASTGQQKQLLTGHKKAIYAVVFSPDGRWLASASADKTVKLWDVAAGREVHTFTGHEDIVTSLAFSPDGRWLASGSWDKTIKIWDVETGMEVQTLAGNGHSVYSIAFDSSGQWLASGSEDGKINLWRSAAADQARAR